MMLNYCPNCGHRLEHTTNACESCGADLEAYRVQKYSGDFTKQLEKMMQDLIQNNEGVLKEMAEKMAKGEASPKGMFFSVEMRDGKPVIKSGDIEEFQRRMGNMPLPSFLKDMMQKHNYALEFKEAKAVVREEVGGKSIRILMPGVSSMADIEIHRGRKGLEISGKTQKTVYFSQVVLNSRDTVLRAELKNGLLCIDTKN